MENQIRQLPERPVIRLKKRISVSKTKNIFCNVSVLCGTAVVIAITVKVIVSLF